MSLLTDLQAMYDPASKQLHLDTTKLGALGTSLAATTGGKALVFGGVNAAPAQVSGTIGFSAASLSVTGGAPLLGFPAGKIARASCAVYAADTAPVLVITAVPGAGFAFSDAVAWLASTFWDDLGVVTDASAAAPALLISTGKTLEPTLGISLSEGFSFSGTLDESKGVLSPVGWLLGSRPRAFGPIALASNGPPVMTLLLTLPNAAGGLGGVFPSLQAAFSARLTDKPGDPDTVAGLHLDVPLSWGGQPVTLSAVVLPGGATMELLLLGPLGLPNPADSTLYLGGADVLKYLPSQLGSALSSIHVGRVALGVGLGTHKLDYARVTLTTLESQTISIVPSIVEVGNIAFNVTVFHPGTAAQQTFYRLSGTLDVGGVDLLVSSDLVPTPRTPIFSVVARMDDDSEIDLTMIAAKFGLPSGAPKIAVTELALGASTAGTYFVQVELESHPIGDESAPFVLDDLSFELDHDGTATAITLQGVMHIAGVDVSISLSNQGGWVIEGDAGQEQPIEIGALIDDLGQRFGVQAPALLKSLVLRNLHFSYAPATGAFSFSVEGDFTFAGAPAVMTVAIQVSKGAGGYSATFLGTLSFIGLTFSLDLSTGGDKVLTLALPPLPVGDALARLVRLVDPNFDFALEPPWDKLGEAQLTGVSLVFDDTKKTVGFSYVPSPAIDLAGLATLTSVEVQYSKSKSVMLTVSGSVLGQSFQPGAWDVVNQPAPALPTGKPPILDLRYIGLGQHISLSTLQSLTTVGAVMNALEATPPEQDPTTGLAGFQFDAGAGWFVGLDFTLLDTVSLSIIFNDPTVYGLLLSLKGEKAKALAGLSFEILYRKIADNLGLYHIDLALPTVMRHLEFGEVSVTLPHIVLDVYTNGNFLVDFGFPYHRDFSQSLAVEVFPFTGAGGFYFGVLDSQTSMAVPRIKNGMFKPVIVFGIGLQVGVGKTIDEGCFSAGVLVAVEGILEGVLAFFQPSDQSAKETYWALVGSVGISAHVFGSIDFVIVQASVDLYVFANVQITAVCHRPILLEMSAGVSVSLSVRVCWFIHVHVSFSTTVHESFTIGSESATPWILE